MKPHTCHAIGCTVPVPAKHFMCARHWFAVPKHLRDRVWQTYRPGQEVTKDPSVEYCEAAAEAKLAVAAQEAGRPFADLAEAIRWFRERQGG